MTACCVCGYPVNVGAHVSIHPRCRLRMPAAATERRRAIIAAVTHEMPTRQGRAVQILQPMPGQSWDDLFAHVYQRAAAKVREAA